MADSMFPAEKSVPSQGKPGGKTKAVQAKGKPVARIKKQTVDVAPAPKS